jgi:hypothetical protein
VFVPSVVCLTLWTKALSALMFRRGSRVAETQSWQRMGARGDASVVLEEHTHGNRTLTLI